MHATPARATLLTVEDWSTPLDLTGKFLIAMPAMADPRFERGVILLCDHSAQGSMGFILNKPVPDLKFPQLLDQIEIPRTPALRPTPVHYGGPVESGRGFVLHSQDWHPSSDNLHIKGGYRMTTSQEVLVALGRGEGPAKALLALGYAGWGPGQLESEIRRNDWLTAEAQPDLVFAADPATTWAKALASLGIDPLTLSSTAGRA